MIVSAFPDSIYPSILEQSNLLINSYLENIDLRNIDCKNVTDITESQLINIRELLLINKIKVHTIGSQFGKKKFNTDIRFDEEEEALRKCINTAKIFNCKNIRIFSYFCEKNQKMQVYNFINKLFQRIPLENINICVENEKGTSFEELQDFLQLRAILKCPNLKITFDVANFVECGLSWDTYLKQLAPLIECLHIRDISKDIPYQSVPIGEGDCFNILSLCKLFHQYKLNIVYEPKLRNVNNREDIFLNDIIKIKEAIKNV